MKNTIKILVILLLVNFTITSCDEIEDLADVDFNTQITERIPIHFDAEVDQGIIDQHIILSLDNSDTHDYLNKIKDVTITKVTYKIIDLVGGDQYSDIQTDFSMDAFDLDQNVEINVKSAFENQTVFEIADVSKLNNIANAIKNNKQVSANINGYYRSFIAADFKIEITVYLDVTANPL